MPNYNEIIKDSQTNVLALSNKLKELDELHQNIKEIIKQPEIFDNWYKQIVELSEDYLKTLGSSNKKYIDGNNKALIERINEISVIIEQAKEEFNNEHSIIEKHSLSLKKQIEQFSSENKRLCEFISIFNEKNNLTLRQIKTNRIINIVGFSILIIITVSALFLN